MELATNLKYWALTQARILRSKYRKRDDAREAAIDVVVEKAAGSSMIRKVRIANGESNEVYSVDLANGQEVVVRISSKGAVRFEAERWAIEQCAGIGVPVPHVIAVEAIEHEGKSLSLSIENKLPGITLDEAANKGLPDKDLTKLLRDAGNLLSRINSVRASSFGDLDAHGNGKCDYIGEMFSPHAINQDHFMELADVVDLHPEVMKLALNALYRYSVKYPAIAPRLIHNDFAPKNVLVRGNAISGILDFEYAQGGDPVQEFACWQFFIEQRYPLKHLMEGYDNQSIFEDDFGVRSCLWRLYIGITNMERFAQRKHKWGVDHCKKRITEDVAIVG